MFTETGRDRDRAWRDRDGSGTTACGCGTGKLVPCNTLIASADRQRSSRSSDPAMSSVRSLISVCDAQYHEREIASCSEGLD